MSEYNACVRAAAKNLARREADKLELLGPKLGEYIENHWRDKIDTVAIVLESVTSNIGWDREETELQSARAGEWAKKTQNINYIVPHWLPLYVRGFLYAIRQDIK